MDFIESLHMLVGFWKDVNSSEQAKAQQILTSKIEGLAARGLWLFGRRSRESLPEGTEAHVVRLAVVRSENDCLIQPKSLSELGEQMCGVVVAVDQSRRVVSPLQLITPLDGIRDFIMRGTTRSACS
jgi:hypothetical protein